jgi:hypothetical protein
MEEGQVEIVPTCSAHRESATIHELLECYMKTLLSLSGLLSSFIDLLKYT